MTDGNSDDAPPHSDRAVLRVRGGLEQLNANVCETDVNEETQSCYFERVHRLTPHEHDTQHNIQSIHKAIDHMKTTYSANIVNYKRTAMCNDED